MPASLPDVDSSEDYSVPTLEQMGYVGQVSHKFPGISDIWSILPTEIVDLLYCVSCLSKLQAPRIIVIHNL